MWGLGAGSVPLCLAGLCRPPPELLACVCHVCAMCSHTHGLCVPCGPSVFLPISPPIRPGWAHPSHPALAVTAGEGALPPTAGEPSPLVVHSVLLDECSDTVYVAGREVGKVGGGATHI